VICDEFQDFAALPLSFADAIAQSRGYAVSWVLAHQHLAQLDTATRQAVLANCRSRVVMQTTASDAAAFAREFAPHVEAADLQGLGPFEGYAAVSVGAAVAPPASIRTRPMPPGLGAADGVRRMSRQRHGTPPAEVDNAIRARVIGRRPTAPVGGVRRAP
jgi:DNA helicase HerA-like ATPase